MSHHPANAADSASPSSSNPFEAARDALIARLQKLAPPKALITFPHPSDFEVVAEHIRDAANIFDEWLAAVGGEIAVNAPSHVDLRLFTGTFHAAVDGDAAYAVEECGMDLREMRRAS